MKSNSLHELKKELTTLTPEKVLEYFMRVARYKKENKELLQYLLFESHDEESFIQQVKNEIDEQAAEINKSNVYFAKKSFRKILRMVNKYGRYSGVKQTQIELLMHYCRMIKTSGIAIDKSAALSNLYQNQLKKITGLIETLHEDLQYDYKKELDLL